MISFIVAMDSKSAIGKNNELPWHLPADLAFFKKTTMGKPIIMGRKTFESIGRPLPGRENIVITRDKDFVAEGCNVIHDLKKITQLGAGQEEEIFVIGGAEIFNEMLPYADRLYVTKIEEEFDGDTFFPPFDKEEWELKSKEKGPKDDKNPYDYYFMTYDRK
ncbi:dihydrofolate reductase [Rossellomorea aquimaris]|uniref:Dihydrofolate reductase n=1 Tax=Rossellomorea aquimaris TaxID=189382 RepID=A0A1J6W418_9BACI|nr:dihydrofolate reductase [Rossellomorea aquimaris]OIU71316.1 dihydrofolate reductase [Rossellomorea aquimaris]